MRERFRELIRDVTAALLFGLALALAVPQAYAGMIGVEDLERDRVKAMLAQPQLAAELEKMGVSPQEASARVSAMTPSEVRQLAGRLDALAAGGQSNRDLLLVILLVLLLILIL